MTSLHEIGQLRELVERMKAKDERKFFVFGASSHQYKFWPPLTEEELQEFERKHQITLPEDYRLFLKEVGNGGAGPSSGLERLQRASSDRDLSKPFLLTKDTELYSEEELDAFGDRDEYPGILEICQHGCGHSSFLVVNGPTYATIWEGYEGFEPTGLSFSTWYRLWAEKWLGLMV